MLINCCLLQPARDLVKTITERGAQPPKACHICSDEFEEAYNHVADVFHGQYSHKQHLALPGIAKLITSAESQTVTM